MKRAVAVIVAGALSSLPLQISNAATPKAGTSCPKLNQVQTSGNLKFTCIKSGKKLVWSKGVVVTKPSPTPTNSLTPTASPTPVQAQGAFPTPPAESNLAGLASAFSDSGIMKAYGNLHWIIDYSKGNVNLDKINFIIDPETPAGGAQLIKDKFLLSLQLYKATNPDLDLPIRVYIYNSKNFDQLADLMRKDLTAEALFGGWLDMKSARAKEDPNGFYGGASPGYGKDGVPVLFFNLTASQVSTYVGLHVYTHELVHVYQRKILGNMQRMTCWMREGQAVYLGFNLATTDKNSFIDAWKGFYFYTNNDPTTADFYTKTESDWINWMKDQEVKPVTECDPISNYVYGAIMWSYLYGHYGIEKTSAFFTNTAKYPISNSTVRDTPGDSWKKSYFETFGVTPETDYPIIAKYFMNEAKWVKSWKQ